MLFNSWEYAFFLPIVVCIHFALPHRWRWAWLLTASCFFYGYFIPEYLFVLLLTITVDYTAAAMMARKKGLARKVYLWLSIGATCAILFAFKYFDFAARVIGSSTTLGLLLPIGLSFHTFQSLSYVIEVYHRRQKPETHFGIYALYVMFFPQLVAGPIERPQNLLPQFNRKTKIDPRRLASGLRLIVWGLFQKTVVADRLGLMVDHVYDAIDKAPADVRLVATILFAFQIFADFQGYTNIARGSARLLGFELMKNFERPYSAKSVTVFWRRWHISLSTWFRDYLYFPLGGSRKGEVRTVVNLLVTFAISGLWHGANWTFLVWGLLNGAFVVAERRVKYASRILTFSLVTFAWIFFRAKNMNDAFDVALSLPQGLYQLSVRVVQLKALDFEFVSSLGTTATDLLFAVTTILLMQWVQSFEMKKDLGETTAKFSDGIRWISYLAFVSLILLSWIFFPATTKPFIYFQF